MATAKKGREVKGVSDGLRIEIEIHSPIDCSKLEKPTDSVYTVKTTNMLADVFERIGGGVGIKYFLVSRQKDTPFHIRVFVYKIELLGQAKNALSNLEGKYPIEFFVLAQRL
ncbi:TPA: hypothetical protein HA241_05140 [Candidatus Woesearchaeota archaeon]|nr:hypothetical protein [Candidatus Woesearchaeota archaeon]